AKPFQWAEVQTRVKTQLALRQFQQQTLDAKVTTSLAPDEMSQSAFLPDPLPETMSIDLATPSGKVASALPGFADWFFTHPATLHLALAQTDRAMVGSPLALATVRGLFRGLSIDPVLSSRMQWAQRFLASDVQPSGTALRWVQAEFHLGDRTLHYGLVGYRLLHLHWSDRPTLQAIESGPDQFISSLTLAPQDVVVLFNAALQPPDLQSPNAPVELTQILQGATSAAEMLERLWPYFNPTVTEARDHSMMVITSRR
ncbi:MAG: hypothetical protein WCD18_01450, partial [Thermosynechococcaceae cyanobacterium]